MIPSPIWPVRITIGCLAWAALAALAWRWLHVATRDDPEEW